MNGARGDEAVMAETPDCELSEYQNRLRTLAHILREISLVQWVHADSRAHEILDQMTRSRTPMEVDALMDELMIRIGELIAQRTDDHSELHRLAALTGPRARSRLFSHAHTAVEANARGSSARPRTFMKL